VTEQLAKREEEKAKLTAALQNTPIERPAPAATNLTARWAKCLENIEQLLTGDKVAEANMLLKDIIKSVTLTPLDQGYALEITGCVGSARSLARACLTPKFPVKQGIYREIFKILDFLSALR